MKCVSYSIDIVIYLVIVLTLVVATVDYSFAQLILDILWFLMLWLLTLVNYFAMRHINRVIKMLNLPGILANKKLRLFYVGFFFTAAIFNTFWAVLRIARIYEDKKDRVSEAHYRMSISEKALLAG